MTVSGVISVYTQKKEEFNTENVRELRKNKRRHDDC
jgi:hypothetical protein